MLGFILTSLRLRWKKRLFETDWFLRACQMVAPIGFFTVLAGWITTEVGRQPWTVYGLLRTVHSVTPSLSTGDVLISLLSYISVYLLIFPVGILLMIKIVRKGPSTLLAKEPIEGGQPRDPVVTPPEYQS